MPGRAVAYQRIFAVALLVVSINTAPWAAAAESPKRPARASSKTQKLPKPEASEAARAASPPVSPSGQPLAEGSPEIQLLKQQLSAQQRQIEQLRLALEEQRRMLEQALQPARAEAEADALPVELASAKPVVPTSRAAFLASAAAMPVRVAPAPQNGGGDAPAPEVEILKGELEAVAESAHATNQRVAKLETNLSDAEKRNAGRVKGLGNFNFTGDVRLRYEPFFQDAVPRRQRERARARLNLTGKVTDEVSGGVSFATGSLDDVNSTNQTLTGFFTRKTVGFDKYFLTYKPNWFKPLTLQGGKVTYPWYRTPLTFDNDVNPEGFAQTLSFNMKSPMLKNITLVGFQLPFNESSGGYDSFIFGGQLQTRWKLSDRAGLGLYAAGVNFNRADPIAVAIAAGTLRPSLANSNTFRRNAAGDVIGYESKFAYLDLIAVVDYKWSARWPMALTFNFVNNTRAATQERSAYMAEVAFGQLKEAKDVQFGYSYWWLEKDAVIGAFNESDLRASTNVKNHRVQLGYQSLNNVTLQWTMWLGKLADPFQNTSLVPSAIRANCTTAPFTDCHDSLLNRMQFDFIYKF
jgi:hypothetical protein